MQCPRSFLRATGKLYRLTCEPLEARDPHPGAERLRVSACEIRANMVRVHIGDRILEREMESDPRASGGLGVHRSEVDRINHDIDPSLPIFARLDRGVGKSALDLSDRLLDLLLDHRRGRSGVVVRRNHQEAGVVVHVYMVGIADDLGALLALFGEHEFPVDR